MEWEVRWPDGRVEQVAPRSEESWDWKQLAPGVFDVRMGNRNVRIERMEGPDHKGNITVRVNGIVQTLQVLDHQQLLLESMGMSAGVEVQEKHVESPMPGKILQVMVEPGTEVLEGDSLAGFGGHENGERNPCTTHWGHCRSASSSWCGRRKSGGIGHI